MESKKKLVFTVINDLTYDRRMDRICHTLATNGYDVTLLGRVFSDSLPLATKSYQQKRIRCYFNRSIFFYAEYNIRLFFYLLFSDFNLFCAIDLDTILPNRLVSWLRKKKFVFDAHEYFTEVIEIHDKPIVKAVWGRVAKWCLGSNTNAYTVSNSLVDVFKKLYKTSFQVIRNVPLPKQIGTAHKRDRFTFVYVGAVNKGRGLEESIQAIKGLDADLLICGDGDILEDLKSNLPETQKKQVTFTGYLTPEVLEQKITECHAGLLLLKAESLSYYYSLANKFFDYLHAEIPQIVIDFPEYKAIVKDNEIALLSDISLKSIKKNMLLLLNDARVYNKLKGNIKMAKSDFNWTIEQQKLLHFYDDLWKKN